MVISATATVVGNNGDVRHVVPDEGQPPDGGAENPDAHADD
jgi:hypothetical protein